MAPLRRSDRRSSASGTAEAQPPQPPELRDGAALESPIAAHPIPVGPGPKVSVDAAADAAAATVARNRHRAGLVETLEPDATIDAVLLPGERLVAVRRGAGLDRRQPGRTPPSVIPGDLYVTSVRIVHIGERPLAFELDHIREATLLGERLVLLLRDGVCVAVAADHPRLLRVQIASARADRRSQRRTQPLGTSAAARPQRSAR